MKGYIILILITCTSLISIPKAHAQSKGDLLFTEPIGIAPYTFRRSFPHGVEATLDTIQEMGFTEIEGGGGNMDAHEYKKLCDERGLAIPSLGVDYNQLLNNPQEIIDRAKVYGASFVMVAWIPHQGDVFTFEEAEKAVNDFNTAGKILQENGLTLAYHAHGYEFQKYKNETLLDYMMENTDPKYVSFEMDIFWIQFGGGDPVRLLKKYGNRWKLMHLKDMKKGIEKNLSAHTDDANNVTLGTGQIDMKGVLIAAKKAGIQHYFIEDESNNILTQLPASIAYLRNLKY